MRRWWIAAALAAVLVPQTARAQYFGQNKVQYRSFQFQIIRTEHFDVYYYERERAAALDAARMAERGYGRLSRLLGHQWRERKPLILYASQSDFQQTNAVGGDVGEGTGGVTEFAKHRMILPFTGSYADFEHVLQHEMVHAFQYDVFSRGRPGAGIQAITQINPPLWFVEGMAEYLSLGPVDPHTAMWLRDAAIEGSLPTIEQLTYDQRIFPYRYGHAIWAYIGQKWGDEVIGAILQATMTGGIEQAFRRVLGLSLDRLSNEWRDAVQTWYLPQIAEHQKARQFARVVLDKKQSGGTLHVSPQISPDGRRIVYLSERNFFFVDLYIADAESGRVDRRLIRSSFDPNFETLRFVNSTGSWSADGQRFAIAAKSGDQDNLVILDVLRDRVVGRYRLGLNAILNPTWAPDGARLAFTGSEGGISDLYVVDSDGQNLRRLTNDRYADLTPSWSPDGRTIAFTTDRGPGTDFDVLRFGNLRIALYHVDTDSIEVLPEMEVGKNVNPVWAPDGRSLAFVSDRGGIDDLYLYDLGTRHAYQLTHAFTGITGITDLSPAISWARQADRLVFTYYEDGHYNVYTLDNPRSLRREAWRADPGAYVALGNASALPVGGVPLAARAARADTAAAAPAAEAVGAGAVPASASIYRGGGGQLRPSDARPAADSGGAGPLSVQRLLDSATLALPDTADFIFHPYEVRFTPDYVSRPTIGYTRDNFGRGIFGGSTVQLSDMLGNHTLLFSGMVNGRLSEAQVQAVYINSAHRWNWAVGASQEPLFLYGNSSYESGTGPNGGDVLTERLFRYVFRQAFAQSVYPISQFKRVEMGLRLTNIGRSWLNLMTEVDPATGYPISYGESITDTTGITYVQPTLALVKDNSLFGYTSNFYGERYRLEVAPAFGGWQFTQLLADYRRYQMLVFPVSISVRAMAIGRLGRDGGTFPVFLGYPDMVRGYTFQSYTSADCSTPTTQSASFTTGCPELDQLLGSRIAVFNAEFRFPLVRSLTLGFLPVGFPPIEAAIFYDAGIAWNGNSAVHLRRPTSHPCGIGEGVAGTTCTGPDLAVDRWPVTSYGIGARINLFGFTVLRIDYAVPLQRPRGGYWIVSLGPPF
jgi:Tol biopolymer transport system component